MVKNMPACAGDERDPGSIPGAGRSPGGGCGNPLQYSGLENSTHRGAWQATVPGVGKSRAQLITAHGLHTHASQEYSLHFVSNIVKKLKETGEMYRFH